MDKVFEALATERRYQLRRWGIRQPDGTLLEGPHEVAAWTLFMQDYLTEATRQLSRESDPTAALATLRKVVTLGVACFEEHGVPLRDWRDLVVNGRDGLPS